MPRNGKNLAFKQRKHNHKDLPRYKSIRQFEAEFKSSYAKFLGDGLAEVVKVIKDTI